MENKEYLEWILADKKRQHSEKNIWALQDFEHDYEYLINTSPEEMKRLIEESDDEDEKYGHRIFLNKVELALAYKTYKEKNPKGRFPGEAMLLRAFKFC